MIGNLNFAKLGTANRLVIKLLVSLGVALVIASIMIMYVITGLANKSVERTSVEEVKNIASGMEISIGTSEKELNNIEKVISHGVMVKDNGWDDIVKSKSSKPLQSVKKEDVESSIKKGGYYIQDNLVVIGLDNGGYLLVDYPVKEIETKLSKDMIGTLASIIGILVVLIIILTIYTFRSIKTELKPLTYLEDSSERLTKGITKEELTKAYTIIKGYSGADKLENDMGNLYKMYSKLILKLNNMIPSIEVSVGDLEEVTKRVESSLKGYSEETKEINKNAVNVLENITRQTEITEEKTIAVSDMAKALQNVAEDTVTISSISTKALTASEGGIKDVGNLVERMKKILATNEQLITAVHHAEDEQSKIELLLKKLNDIADQTNLLSLNASIESARAGEHGKGFNVVAQEVRKLATESKQMSNEITEVLKGIKTTNEDLKVYVNESNNEIKDGNQYTMGVKERFDDVLELSNNLDDAIQNASAVVEELKCFSRGVKCI